MIVGSWSIPRSGSVRRSRQEFANHLAFIDAEHGLAVSYQVEDGCCLGGCGSVVRKGKAGAQLGGCLGCLKDSDRKGSSRFVIVD
jgi:hypothetical protein